jgi:integrase
MSRKKPGPPRAAPLDPDAAVRQAVFERFQLEDLQYLAGDDLLAAQQLCGHGNTPGYWETKLARLTKHEQRIDLAARIRSSLSNLDEDAAREVSADLITEGVQALTRLCLLARLAPTGGTRTSRTRPLKDSTVARICYVQLPQLIARAIRRKAAEDASDHGLFCRLNEEDLQPTRSSRLSAMVSVEVTRLYTLADKGLWSDIPERRLLPMVTDPCFKRVPLKPEIKSVPYLPLPLDWLAEIGPRVLWVVTELAPHLLRLLEASREPLRQPHPWRNNTRNRIRQIIEAELARDPWLDAAGQPLVPPFPLETASGNGGTDRFEWPVRTWENMLRLSTIVQSAHAFVSLLATAGRVMEDATLDRSCIEMHADGSRHVLGRTYKLNWAPDGHSRTWPAPDMLVRALGQQARLAAAWDWLPLSMECGGAPTAPQFGNQLWVSIGFSGKCGPEARFMWKEALMRLARRLGVTDKPGGKNVHPHRFRKTTSRLAGVALWNSPVVLKQLLGHKDIETTLHYILSVPSIREEANKVLRELRVMHCAETLQQVRDALKAGLANPFGGVGGSRLASAVTEHEKRESDDRNALRTCEPVHDERHRLAARSGVYCRPQQIARGRPKRLTHCEPVHDERHRLAARSGVYL